MAIVRYQKRQTVFEAAQAQSAARAITAADRARPRSFEPICQRAKINTTLRPNHPASLSRSLFVSFRMRTTSVEGWLQGKFSNFTFRCSSRLAVRNAGARETASGMQSSSLVGAFRFHQVSPLSTCWGRAGLTAGGDIARISGAFFFVWTLIALK